MQRRNSGNDRLTDDEIMSDTFVFLLAGHESTSHALCFMICLLALHPEAQAKVYAEACELWPEAPSLDAPPEYKGSLPHLEYTTAVFYESMRLFPPVVRLMKSVFTDTILKTRRFTTNTDGSLDNVEVVNTPIKAGSVMVLDINGLHYNPIHWGEDVDKFKPERFIDTETYKWPRDAFSGFSQGQRSCIGQRFAVTEAVCIVANLVRRYEILVPAYLESKPKVEQEKELLECTLKLSVTPKNARVRLAKRVTKRGA
ncbi:cytochrome P450 [Amanita rubescens]|nr:cytochrome P450 [Amanita rubescens]